MPIWAANSRARLNRDELHQLRWLLGLGLVLLAFWTLFGLEIGGLAWRAAFFMTAASALVWPAWPSYIPAWVRRWSLILGGAALLSEIIATRFDVLSGLVLMVSLLTLSRGLQYRRLRQDWQLIVLCLFIIVLSGVLTLDLLFGVQILLFTVVTMVLLFVMNLLQRDSARALAREDWRHFRWRHFAGRVWRALDLRQSLQAAALFIGLVVFGTVIFVAMPRYQFEQSIAFAGVKGVAGFSDVIEYNKQSISSDDSIAFRVDAPPNFKFTGLPYWRMIVLDDYKNNGFKATSDQNRFLPYYHNQIRYPDENDPVAHAQVKSYLGTWTFYLEGNVSEYLPILGPFHQLTFSSTQSFHARDGVQVYRIEQTSSKVLGYEVQNMGSDDVMPAAAEDLQPDLTLAMAEEKAHSAPILQYPYTYFSLPSGQGDRAILDAKVKEIEGNSPALPLNDFITATVDYLQKNHPAAMSLDLVHSKTAGHDALVHWLNTPNSSGWCEYFAGSFVLLARAAGFPARVVSGYKGAEYNPMKNYYVVRQDFAHSWAEVFASDGAGRGHWVRDPSPDITAANLTPGAVGGGMTVASGWSAYVDSLRMIWYRRVINFDQTDQQEMVQTMEDYGKAQLQKFKQWFADLWLGIRSWFLQSASPAHYFILSALLAAVVLGWWQAATLRNAWLRVSASRWWGRGKRLSPVRLAAGRWLQQFEPVWLAHAADLPPEERSAWTQVRGELLALRYGPPDSAVNATHVFNRARMLLKRKFPTTKVD